MGRRILRERLAPEHVADVALAHLVGLAQHPHLLERRRVELLQHVLDERLAHGTRLAQHPDLLALLGVRAAEDLLGEGAADLARLREHPALLGLAGGQRRGAGDRPWRGEDRALRLGRHQVPGLVTIRKIAISTSALPISVAVRTCRNSASYSGLKVTAPWAGAAAMSRPASSPIRRSRGLKYPPPAAS